MYIEKQEQSAILLRQAGIIPVLAIENVETGLKLCEALVKGGLKALEITYRTKAAPDIIREAKKRFPEILLGAGTLPNLDHMIQAFALGASFGVAPGFNPAIVAEAVKSDYAFSPGIATPSEIEQAYAMGVRLMKFFPAEALGGTAMLKAITAPYRHLKISIMPTGGVTPANAADYLAIPEIAAVGGTWLGKASDVQAGNWKQIEEDAAKAMQLLAQARS